MSTTDDILTGVDFGGALDRLRAGTKVKRVGWNGKGMWLTLVTDWNGNVGPATGDFKMLPFIAMRTAQGDFVPWLASQTDLLANDWFSLYDEADAAAHSA